MQGIEFLINNENESKLFNTFYFRLQLFKNNKVTRWLYFLVYNTNEIINKSFNKFFSVLHVYVKVKSLVRVKSLVAFLTIKPN